MKKLKIGLFVPTFKTIEADGGEYFKGFRKYWKGQLLRYDNEWGKREVKVHNDCPCTSKESYLKEFDLIVFHPHHDDAGQCYKKIKNMIEENPDKGFFAIDMGKGELKVKIEGYSNVDFPRPSYAGDAEFVRHILGLPGRIKKQRY